jgi:hypothetical protein
MVRWTLRLAGRTAASVRRPPGRASHHPTQGDLQSSRRMRGRRQTGRSEGSAQRAARHRVASHDAARRSLTAETPRSEAVASTVPAVRMRSAAHSHPTKFAADHGFRRLLARVEPYRSPEHVAQLSVDGEGCLQAGDRFVMPPQPPNGVPMFVRPTAWLLRSPSLRKMARLPALLSTRPPLNPVHPTRSRQPLQRTAGASHDGGGTVPGEPRPHGGPEVRSRRRLHPDANAP